LAVGESQVWSLIVGLDRDAQGSTAACKYNINIPAFPLPEMPAQAAVMFEARLTVRAASVERIELDVDWERYAHSGDGGRRKVAGDHVMLVLGEDQRRILDVVEMRSTPEWGACYSNVGVEVKASMAEAPDLALRRIAYDLWLIDEGPGGPEATQRWQMAGKQGEARDFDFEPLRRPFPGGEGEASGGRVDTRIFGQVRGRVQSDGSLEVALLAKREDNPSHRHWAVGGAGEKRLRVSAGETIRLELPAPSPDVSHETYRSELKRDVDHGVLSSVQQRTVSLVLTARPVE